MERARLANDGILRWRLGGRMSAYLHYGIFYLIRKVQTGAICNLGNEAKVPNPPSARRYVRTTSLPRNYSRHCPQ